MLALTLSVRGVAGLVLKMDGAKLKVEWRISFKIKWLSIAQGPLHAFCR